MQIKRLALDGVFEIIPARSGDTRGFFSETWKRAALAEHGIDLDFVQDNHSLSILLGTLRGIHYQTPPVAQDKLVRCTRGRVFDVAVDLRASSPTRGQWVSLILDAGSGNQILVPKGFGHGFQTLEPDCEVQYKVTAPYAPECDRSIRWDDPDIRVQWPIKVNPDFLSPKDRNAPFLSEQTTGF